MSGWQGRPTRTSTSGQDAGCWRGMPLTSTSGDEGVRNPRPSDPEDLPDRHSALDLLTRRRHMLFDDREVADVGLEPGIGEIAEDRRNAKDQVQSRRCRPWRRAPAWAGRGGLPLVDEVAGDTRQSPTSPTPGAKPMMESAPKRIAAWQASSPCRGSSRNASEAASSSSATSISRVRARSGRRNPVAVAVMVVILRSKARSGAG